MDEQDEDILSENKFLQCLKNSRASLLCQPVSRLVGLYGRLQDSENIQSSVRLAGLLLVTESHNPELIITTDLRHTGELVDELTLAVVAEYERLSEYRIDTKRIELVKMYDLKGSQLDKPTNEVKFVPLLKGDVICGVAFCLESGRGGTDLNNSQLIQFAHSFSAVQDDICGSARDSVTGLYSRECFNAVLEEKFAYCQRYNGKMSLAFIDVDHFKVINDQHGHRAGDHVLARLGEIIKSEVRGSDAAFRYGGDELVVILPETDLDGAAPIADRLLEGVRNSEIVWNGKKIQLTVSVGISQFLAREEETPTLEGLLQNADDALYQAKKQGRNQVRRFS